MTFVRVWRHVVIALVVGASSTALVAFVGVALSSGVLPQHWLLDRATDATAGNAWTGPPWTNHSDAFSRVRGYGWETVTLYYSLPIQNRSPWEDGGSLPRWSRLADLHQRHRAEIENESKRGFIEERAYGWPAVCLRAWAANSSIFDRPLSHASIDVGGLFKRDVEHFDGVMDYEWTPLPYLVIPSGAMANIVFWSVLWLVVAFVGRRLWHRLRPIVSRRYRERIRADGELCIHCGYSLAGVGTSRCPECGQARSAAIAGPIE